MVSASAGPAEFHATCRRLPVTYALMSSRCSRRCFAWRPSRSAPRLFPVACGGEQLVGLTQVVELQSRLRKRAVEPVLQQAAGDARVRHRAQSRLDRCDRPAGSCEPASTVSTTGNTDVNQPTVREMSRSSISSSRPCASRSSRTSAHPLQSLTARERGQQHVVDLRVVRAGCAQQRRRRGFAGSTTIVSADDTVLASAGASRSSGRPGSAARARDCQWARSASAAPESAQVEIARVQAVQVALPPANSGALPWRRRV